MALSKLSEDQHRTIFSKLCNVLEPWIAVDFSSVSPELRALTQALRQQLRTDHEAAVATLCLKMGMRSFKELREAKELDNGLSAAIARQWPFPCNGLSAADLTLLGSLGSVLPALEQLSLDLICGTGDGPEGVQRLMAGLGAGALPALTSVSLRHVHVGEAGASALAAALGRGALPRLKALTLKEFGIGDAEMVALAPALRRLPALVGLDFSSNRIGDAGLVALAPALRRLPALEGLKFRSNPLGSEGLAALVSPAAADALSPTTRVLAKFKELFLGHTQMKLKVLDLSFTQITDAGCAILASALHSGTLPELEVLGLQGIPASAASKAAVIQALADSRGYGSRQGLSLRYFRALRNFRARRNCKALRDLEMAGSLIFWFWVLLNILIAPAVAYDLLHCTRPSNTNIGALELLYLSGGTLALLYTPWICVLTTLFVLLFVFRLFGECVLSA
mgnify:CR=1 FL=1